MTELETAPETARELLFGDRWEYAPAPQSADHVRLADRYGPFIDGEFREVDDYFPSINPATEETLAEVGLANEAIVDDAVSAARSAYESRWRDLPGAERAKYIYRIVYDGLIREPHLRDRLLRRRVDRREVLVGLAEFAIDERAVPVCQPHVVCGLGRGGVLPLVAKEQFAGRVGGRL